MTTTLLINNKKDKVIHIELTSIKIIHLSKKNSNAHKIC